MPDYVSQAEFARRVGCSRNNIAKALKRGTIQATGLDKSGRKLIDYETQSIAYMNNRDMKQVRNSKVSKETQKKPKKNKTPSVKKILKQAGSVKEEIEDIPDIGEVSQQMPEVIKNRLEAVKGIVPVYGTPAYNANRKVAIDADRNELKYATELGEVIPTEVAILIAANKMSDVKEALLAYPSRTVGMVVAEIKSKVKEFEPGGKETLYNDVLRILTESVKDVLFSLANSVDSLPKEVDEYLEKRAKRRR